MYSLKNKVSIVTGGSNGIGKSVTQLLSISGSVTYFLDLNEDEGRKLEDELNQKGYKAHFVKCDVSDHSMVSQVITRIAHENDQIDILVNNAGIAHIGTATSTTPDDMDRIVSVNINGVFNCLNATIPFMQKSGGGVIINMTSVAAEMGIAERFAYSMSKGAVSAMTLSVAKDYINDNIRCNGIAPGRVHTPFVDNYLKKTYPGKEDEMFEKLSKTQPIGRMGKPEEIASLIGFLCSDEAAFITGTIYPIDGGFIKLNS